MLFVLDLRRPPALRDTAGYIVVFPLVVLPIDKHAAHQIRIMLLGVLAFDYLDQLSLPVVKLRTTVEYLLPEKNIHGIGHACVFVITEHSTAQHSTAQQMHAVHFASAVSESRSSVNHHYNPGNMEDYMIGTHVISLIWMIRRFANNISWVL